jgi:hypothetical protein
VNVELLARVAEYLHAHPAASANDVYRGLAGKRIAGTRRGDVLRAVEAVCALGLVWTPPSRPVAQERTGTGRVPGACPACGAVLDVELRAQGSTRAETGPGEPVNGAVRTGQS